MRVVEPDEKHVLKDKRINVLTYSMLIQSKFINYYVTKLPMRQ